MPIPKVRSGEDKATFIRRCIQEMHDIDPDRSNEQIIAICYSQWDKYKEKGVSKMNNTIDIEMKDDLEESSVRRIKDLHVFSVALVDNPAIGVNFLTMKSNGKVLYRCSNCGFEMRADEEQENIKCLKCGSIMNIIKQEDKGGNEMKEKKENLGKKETTEVKEDEIKEENKVKKDEDIKKDEEVKEDEAKDEEAKDEEVKDEGKGEETKDEEVKDEDKEDEVKDENKEVEVDVVEKLASFEERLNKIEELIKSLVEKSTQEEESEGDTEEVKEDNKEEKSDEVKQEDSDISKRFEEFKKDTTEIFNSIVKSIADLKKTVESNIPVRKGVDSEDVDDNKNETPSELLRKQLSKLNKKK